VTMTSSWPVSILLSTLKGWGWGFTSTCTFIWQASTGRCCFFSLYLMPCCEREKTQHN
jgi:hypothetical protein